MSTVTGSQFATFVAERGDRARIRFNTAVSTTANDTVPFATTLTAHDFFEESSRTIGILIDMDKGSGALERVTAAEIGTSIAISGSLEGFGARTASFTWLGGADRSPLRTRMLSAPRRIRIKGVRGTLGGERTWTLFDGFLRDADYSVHPPGVAITAQESLLGLEKLLVYSVAARSMKSRRTVVTEICQRNGITLGTLTFTDGANVGGYVIKEIAEAGQRTVGQFLAEFLIPTGCRFYLREGKLYVKRFLPSDTSVRRYKLSDVSLSIPAPPSSTPNVIRVSGAIYPYTGPDLTGTVITTVSTSGSYTPAKATHKQDSTDGSLDPVTPTVSAQTEVGREVTTTTYEGGTITAQTIETYSWYAPLACNKKLNSDGTTRYNETFDVWLFPDGSYRSQEAETFMVTTKYTMSKTWNAQSWLSNQREYWYEIGDVPMPIAQRNGADTADVAQTNRYVRDDGSGWLYGKETTDPTYDDVRVTVNIVPTYDAQTLDLQRYEIQGTIARQAYFIESGVAANRYKFGPTASPTWTTYPKAPIFSTNLFEMFRTTYTEVTAESHQVTTVGLGIGTNIQRSTLFGYSDLPVFATGSDATVATPLPKVEMKTSVQVQMPASVTVPNYALLSLNRGVEIQESVESGWCETTDEMEAAGLEHGRRLWGVPVGVQTTVDFAVDEGDVVTIPSHPDIGMGDVKLLVLSQSVSVDLATAANTHTLDCLYYPAEIA